MIFQEMMLGGPSEREVVLCTVYKQLCINLVLVPYGLVFLLVAFLAGPSQFLYSRKLEDKDSQMWSDVPAA